MATRKGATKTVSGKRYRYNGTKWVQIKATGNVKPTSSSNRSARSNRSNATVTNSSNRQRRGGVKTTTDTQRTSTGSARVTTKPKALPPGTRGGALATTNSPRRRNVNSNPPSSGVRSMRGGVPPKLRGVLEAQGLLPPASTPKGTSKPTDGRRPPTRRETAADKARRAAQGSRSSTTRVPPGKMPRRMGPLSTLVERGLTNTLTPVAEYLGYEGGKAIRKALGGGAPKLDKNGKPIKKPVAKGPGLKDVNGKPLPAPRGAFDAVVTSKVPKGSTTPPKTTPPKNTPKQDPKATTAPPRPRSGGSGGGSRTPAPIPTRTRTPQKKGKGGMDANYRAWAKANPTLAKKVKKGQAGYKAINSSSSKASSSANAQNLRTGRSPDPKKKKKKVLPYFGGNGIGRY